MNKFLFILFLLIQSETIFCQHPLAFAESKVFYKDSLFSFLLQSPTGNKTYIPTSSKKLSVFVFLSPQCPLSKNYSLTLSDIKKKYDKQVSFIGIIPGEFDAGDVAEFKKNYLSSWAIFCDNTLKLTHYLQGKVTPEVLVINNKNGFLIYKGAIDDWVVSLGKTRTRYSNFYLENALSDFLNNKKILISYHKPVGCFINDF